MYLLTPGSWTDYELIDSGNFHKIERFGAHIVWRPEPQACWDCAMDESEWIKMADVRFVRDGASNSESGQWEFLKRMPDRWFINYRNGELKIRMRLALTGFKHLGVFPEQAVNWDFIYDALRQYPQGQAKALNLFAYTGGASLAAKAAGADVVHVDSVKPVVNWARENMEASGLDGIRWLVEDAMKFMRREVRRGSLYQAVILDPPAYGRGPAGEKWVLADGINEMMKLSAQLLDKERGFLLLNLYSMGYSALVAENLGRSCFGPHAALEPGELYVSDRAGRKLPLGTFLRVNTKH